MNKNIQLILISCFVCHSFANAQVEINTAKKTQNSTGYYQTINLDDQTPCNCKDKTQRTHDLAKGLIEKDVLKYKLYAYKFTFGESTLPVSKLFKALENDSSVYKVSMIEWSSFLLLTTNKFDNISFETAAQKAFGTFSSILPEDFLKAKNTTSYLEYKQAIDEQKRIEKEYNQSNQMPSKK